MITYHLPHQKNKCKLGTSFTLSIYIACIVLFSMDGCIQVHSHPHSSTTTGSHMDEDTDAGNFSQCSFCIDIT